MSPKKKGEKGKKAEAEAPVKEPEIGEEASADAAVASADAKAHAPDAKAEGDAPKAEGDASKEGESEAAKGDEEGDDDDASPAAKSMLKGEEKPKELEVDAEPNNQACVSGVALSEYDSTLDVFFSGGGSIVSSLSQGGFQHLLSGIRANTGAKGGRHLFEVKVLEKKTSETDSTMRIGVSTARSSLFLGDKTPDSACFDLDGTYYSPTLEDPRKCQNKAFARKIQYQVIGILLNLDSGSPNANTISLFLDGVRLSEPMPLPAHLVGKALYPTITFKNFTLAVNLGCDGLVMKRLPFTCRMFANAVATDTESTSYKSPSAGSKYSVVLPVGLPEEGFFDYVDRFLERHPDYVELSDRKLLEWCVKSGLSASTGKSAAGPSSRDRPGFNFGIPSIDNRGIRNQVRQLSQLVKRNYIIGELKGNLTSKEREEVLARFATQHFSVTAHVAVGEPPAEQKDWVHRRMSAAFAKKQADAVAAKKRGEERKRAAAERTAERAKARGAKENKDKEVEEPEKASDEPPEKKQKLDQEAKEEEKETGPDIGPHVWYLPHSKSASEDMGKRVLAQSYANFTVPSDSEGFDKVEFMWAQKASGEDYLQKWIVEQKANLIIEDLKPGEWFKDKQKAWTQLLKDMKSKKHTKEKAAKKEKADDDAGDEDKASEAKSEEAVDPLHAGGENGQPLYADFLNEDWLLLSWRYQLHLLLHSFAADAGAKDVHLEGIPVDHVAHYFNTYFNKQGKFSPRSLGCAGLEQVVELMDDLVKIQTSGKMRFLASLLDKETDVIAFVKKVEECRQDRVRRIEAGDESARLKIPEGGPRDDDEGGRSWKKSKGKGKGGKGQKNKNRKGGESSQEQQGTWVRKGALGKFKARHQEGKGFGKKKGFGRREVAQPQQEATTRPWDRNRTTNFARVPLQQPNFADKGKGKGKGRGSFHEHQRRPFQDQRSAPNFQQKRPPPQQEARRFPSVPQRTSGQKGGGHSSPRSYSDAPDAKRPRYASQPAVSSLPTPPRPPQHSWSAPSSQRQPSRGPPQRSSAPAALPPPVRPSPSKGGFRGSGSNRDFEGHGSRDAGHRPSYNNSSKGGGHSDRGGSKGDNRRPNDSGKDRHNSNGPSKGGGSKGGDRRDGRDRGHPSSGGHSRGERDQRDHGRRAY